MMGTITIDILVENTAGRHGLLAEHGFACWIDTGDCRVLFDAGQGLGNVLTTNAEGLGIPLDRTDAIALSHGHYDHTGGLPDVLALANRPTFYAHPAAFDARYTNGTNGVARNLGIPIAAENAVHAAAVPTVYTEHPTEIHDGVFVTGQVPRLTAFEDTGGAFYLDADLSVPDPIDDDQALFFQTSKGTVVVLGCAHAGVVNTLHYIRKITRDHPIDMVIGGMHLGAASDERLDETIVNLHRLGVRRIAPCHCTGMRAVSEIRRDFDGEFLPCQVGSSFVFER